MSTSEEARTDDNDTTDVCTEMPGDNNPTETRDCADLEDPIVQRALVLATAEAHLNAWHADPIKLARYTNGLLLIGVLVSLIFHGEMAYAIWLISDGGPENTLLIDSLVFKLAIWAGVHQVPILLHGGGTIALRGNRRKLGEDVEWKMRPWLIGSEIFGISFMISLGLLLWATHVYGTKYLCMIIALDLLAEAIIWGGVRYVKDHKGAITLLAQMVGLVPQFMVKRGTPGPK
jgi:hypothetical protein